MRPLILLLFVCVTCNVLAQKSLDSELSRISRELAQQLKTQKIKRVAVIEINFRGQPHTGLGEYIANKLSSRLSMNSGGTYTLVPRETVLQQLQASGARTKPDYDLQGIGQKGSDALSKDQSETKEERKKDYAEAGLSIVNELVKIPGKPLKGIDVTISGTLEERGDNIELFVQMVKNKRRKDIIGGSEGVFIITPEIENMKGQSMDMTMQSSRFNTPDVAQAGGGGVVFPETSGKRHKQGNITMELVGCRQSGQEVECDFKILSSSADDVIQACHNGTKIISASGGLEFHVKEITLAEISSDRCWMKKELARDTPIDATFRFVNVNQKIPSIKRIDLHMHCDSAGGFWANFYDVPMR